jgi:two-component system, OmpR family, sensor histidine kinase CiaH
MGSVFRQIRWRLVAWSIGVLALILALAGTAVYVVLAHSLVADVDRELATRGELVTERLLERADGDYRFRREGYIGGLFYLLVDGDGAVIANPQAVRLDPSDVDRFPDSGPLFMTIDLDDGPARLYLIALPPRPAGPVALAVGKSLVPEYDTLRQALLALVAAGAVGIAFSVLGGWFLAGRALVPIEDAFRRQQEFVADASHELRTPLTVLRSATDLLYRHRAEPLAANAELFDDVRQEIARLERQAGDLLTLARADLGELGLALGLVDVASLAAEVVRRAAPLAQSQDVTLGYQAAGEPAVVEADPDRLQQVLLILVDNALKHTPSGGRVVVSTRRQGMDAWLEVVDSGDGIDAAHLPRVFDRFYRVDRARARDDGGSGLGLAIAKSLVDAHGGQLALAGAPGGGTRATVRLRLAEHASLTDRLGQLAVQVVHRPSHHG